MGPLNPTDQGTDNVSAMKLTADSRNGIDYKVADLELAEYGRKEIRLAEHEMPGLRAVITHSSASAITAMR
jgi:hypothetical protein